MGLPANVLSLPSVAALQALGVAAPFYQTIEVQAYYVGGKVGGGIFVWSAASTATQDGGSVIQATGVAVGRFLRQFIPGPVLAVDFGAKFDGSADDTVAVQAAITYAGTNGLKTVILPDGTSKITDTLNVYYGIVIQGSGMEATTLYATGFTADKVLLNLDGTVHPVTGTRIEGVEMREFTLRSDNGVAQGCAWHNLANSAVYRIGLYNLHKGVVITGAECFSNVFDQLLTLATVTRTISFESFTGGGQFTFSGCGFGGTVGFFFDNVSTITGVEFLSCNFEGCSQQGFFCEGTMRGVSFNGCRMEHNTAGDIIFRPMGAFNFCLGIAIVGCLFSGNVGFDYSIAFGGDTGFVGGFNISGNYAISYGTEFVLLNGGGDYGAIIGNVIEAVPAVVNTIRPGVLVANNAIYVEAVASPPSAATFTPDGAAWNPPLTTPDITGALSTVADAAAKDVLTSIVAAGVAIGLWTDGTT